ncbi:growth hormone-inducible transmembrane protein-like isoform X2 [Schistocerca americana]|nr:growth hormone-inducible transmembrane protein-like isoform X2 [Schistocerca americana]XP_046990482.1 growth hormone-inducible transmembrane protein-like isoform X2 [Schistocerca americana]
MLITTVCRVSVAPSLQPLRTRCLSMKQCSPKIQIVRCFSNESRNTFSERLARRRSLKEKLLAPAGETAFNIGKGAVAGGAALGLGALCFYGLGLSKQTGAIDHATFWPEYVKQRIRDTYMYFGGSIVVTAASAAAALRSPRVMSLVTKNSFGAIALSFAALIGTNVIVQSIPYQKGFGVKQMAWLAHSAVLGAFIAPICFVGGPVLIRAAWYTAGVVGGLSTVAVCAPSEKFLMMGGPLAIGLGVVFASSLGTMFLPPSTALGAGLYAISMYGGLLLFSGFLLYDTQRIIKLAEVYPINSARPYDPVNASISIYLDTVNIFIRIAMILAGSGSNRRK